MMTADEIVNHLHDLESAHRLDGDGGYSLVSAIRRWAAGLEATIRERLWSELLRLIIDQDQNLWGVSLDVLVQESPQQIGEKLSALIDLDGDLSLWKDQIVFALLRLGYQGRLAECIKYIENGLANNRRSILPLLAALCRVDRTTCLKLSSAFFARALRDTNYASQYSGYIPAFIRTFFEVDAMLLRDLVHNTLEADASSGTRLSNIIREYLNRPFVAEELDQKSISFLQDCLA